MRDGDSKEEETQFLFEAVLSGYELAGSSSLKLGEPLVIHIFISGRLFTRNSGKNWE